jgi:hypothetical protein
MVKIHRTAAPPPCPLFATDGTTLIGSQSGPPNDFEAPLLKWFRGIDAHLIKDGDRLTARAELDVQREAPQGGKFELPLFNLFGGGQKALKPKKPLPPAEELPPPPLPAVDQPPKIDLPPPPPLPGRGVER